MATHTTVNLESRYELKRQNKIWSQLVSVIIMSMPPGVSSGNVLMFTTNYYCQPPSSSKPLLLSKLWQVKRWELKTKTWNSACLSPSEKDCFNRPLYILPCFHLSGGFVRRHFRHCFKILSPSPRQNMKWLYLDVGFLVTTQTLCLSQRCLRKWGLKQPSPSFLEDTLYAVLFCTESSY